METLREQYISLGLRGWGNHFIDIEEKEGGLGVGKGRESGSSKNITEKGEST